MAGIFVAIPVSREYKPFRESLSVFLESIKKVHDVEVLEVKNKSRDEGRNILVDEFLNSNKEYILFLDDDHSGHTPEMLESLIKADKLFCSLKCYARYYPFQITTVSKDIRFHDNHSLYILNTNKGYAPCKFAGFGMALIKRELFGLIDKPYFQCDMIGEREDNYFCEKLEKEGIEITGCFDYVLAHDGIDDSTILEKRQKGIKEFVSRQNQRLTLKRIQNAIESKKFDVSEKNKGKLKVMDLLLNNEIVLMNK